jgi:hypothetical protein
MSEKIKSEVISRRRALSLLGLAAAFGLAVPPTVLMVSDDAEAQYTAPAPAPAGKPAPAPAGKKTGSKGSKKKKHKGSKKKKQKGSKKKEEKD